MEEKLNILESKIRELIDYVKFLKNENDELKKKIALFEEKKEQAVEKIDNLIRILRNEGEIEKGG